MAWNICLQVNEEQADSNLVVEVGDDLNSLDTEGIGLFLYKDHIPLDRKPQRSRCEHLYRPGENDRVRQLLCG